MADNDSQSFVNSLDSAQDLDMPFGVVQPHPVQVMIDLLKGAATKAASLPERAIENSQFSLNTGNYDPSVPMEAAQKTMGFGLPFAEENAAGIFGGKLAKGANLDKLTQAENMLSNGQDRGVIRKLTGWHQGPDAKWRFEIPDDHSKFIQPTNNDPAWSSATGPANYMLLHPELYKNYPQLRGIKMTSEISPGYGEGTGGFNSETNQIVLSSPDVYDARLGALHEMQHAVQDIEGFTPGTNRQAYSPQIYHRTAGEVEARNTEARADMSPQRRVQRAPWDTQDVSYKDQFVIPRLVKALEGK
jgi:Large polyvalent protein associated domain 23